MSPATEPTPNWFASVMGTGILAIDATTLPIESSLIQVAATGLWLAATTALVLLTTAWARQAVRLGRLPFSSLSDPVLVHFYGAPPMAVLTVSAGLVKFAPALIGTEVALRLGGLLWLVGTAAGLTTTFAIPRLARHAPGSRPGFAGRLMPVVPPMVSAATGAALVPHAPVGLPRTALLAACYALFGLSAFASMLLIPRILRGLRTDGLGPIALTPTLWIVLGPLGQSVTASSLLAHAAPAAVPPTIAHAARSFALGYGVPVWCCAALWAGLAATATIRAARRNLPFTLAWWSFTFPLGTWVTGTAALGTLTDSALLRWWSAGIFTILLSAWLIVATRTTQALARRQLPSPLAGLRGHSRPGPRVDQVDGDQQVGVSEHVRG